MRDRAQSACTAERRRAGGSVYGVDISAGMLAQARALCAHNGWSNVNLLQQDAAEFFAAEPLDA